MTPVNVVDPTGRMPALNRSVNPANAGGANAIPFSAPARSVNHAGWATYSDPLARQQSRGHEPFYCGAVRFFNQMLRETDRLLSGLDPLQDAIHDRSKGVLAQIPLERLNGYLDGQGDLIVGLTPVDLVYDLVSLALGRDLLSGRELSHLEEGLILFGFVTGGIGDDIGKLGLRALRLTDEAVQAGGRVLLRSSDELALAGTRLSRHGDEVTDLGRYLDEVGDVRRGKWLLDDTNPSRKRILVVGEDDRLLYARRLAQEHPSWEVVGTRLGRAKEGALPSRSVKAMNPDKYPPNLIRVDNVDATQLHTGEYIDTLGKGFDAVVFNNPHIKEYNKFGFFDLTKTEVSTLNLIRDFRSSAEHVTKKGGELHINVTRSLVEQYSSIQSELAQADQIRRFGPRSVNPYYAPYVPKYTHGGEFSWYEGKPERARYLWNYVFINR